MFHASVPVLSQPVKDKTRLSGVFTAAFGVTLTFCALYSAAVLGRSGTTAWRAHGGWCGCGADTIIGILIALYFGTSTLSQCNLMWEKYVGCMANGGAAGPWWTRPVIIYALLFPACDVASAYVHKCSGLRDGVGCQTASL